MSMTENWLALLGELRWRDLTAAERRSGSLLLADALGNAAGGTTAPGSPEVLSALSAIGAGSIPVPWTPLLLPADRAGAAFSALIHGWDFDDTHDEAVIHASSVAIPAAFAAGMAAGSSGTRVLDGMVAGVQVLSRLSAAIGRRQGMIRTVSLGSVAAAAAAGRAIGLDAKGIGHAMGIALPLTSSPSSRQVVADSAPSKRIQPALMVQAGITAAFLASAGIKGPPGWLEGRFGLLTALDVDPASAASVLSGPGWEGSNLSLKPYPTCRYAQSAIAAAEKISVAVTDIESIDVHVPEGAAYQMVSRPFTRSGDPIVGAQFSIAWLVAAQLLTGRMNLATISGSDLTDPQIDALAARVTVHQDQPPTDFMAAATVRIRTAEGTLEATADMPGSPQNPLSDEVLAEKIRVALQLGGFQPVAVPRVLGVADALDATGSGEVSQLLLGLAAD